MQKSDCIIGVEHVSKFFGDKAVLNDVNLSVRKGEFVTILGPSGCGKTTLLRLIAGFQTASEGVITIAGKDITQTPPHKRPVNTVFQGPSGCGKTTLLRLIAGFQTASEGVITIAGKDITQTPPHKRPVNTVFQKYALFPHLNVFNNIAFGLKLKKLPGATIEKKVKQALRMVGMTDYEDRDVDSLSGGQQQRVAIARAIVNEPEVLLLDEPLAALDLKMRKDMQMELKEMHQKLGITFVYVTHDQEEALTLSDTIVVMSEGRIQQIGVPTDIYNEPINSFVADFIGESNILNGVMIKDKAVTFCGHEFECVDTGFGEQMQVDVVIRPEDIYIFDVSDAAQLTGTVTSCIFKGVHYEMLVQTREGYELMVQDYHAFEAGREVGLLVMQMELKEMHQKLGITFVYVTHDQEEALTLSDTIVVMSEGRIQQIGVPTDIYNEPINSFVADFIGESNILNGVMIKDKAVTFCGHEFECVDTGFGEQMQVDVVIRPEDIYIFDVSDAAQLTGTVTSCIFKGVHYEMLVQTREGYELMVQDYHAFEAGREVGLLVKPFDIHVMKKERTCNTFPFDIHVMKKERTCNTFEGKLVDKTHVEFLGCNFECLPVQGIEPGSNVQVEVDFQHVILEDNEEDGRLTGEVKFILYKGNHYHLTVFTDWDEDIFVDTNDVWDDGDRVGIIIAPENVRIRNKE